MNMMKKIPAGLEGIKRRLIEIGGLNIEGIFRLRGKEHRINNFKKLLNNGEIIQNIDATPIEMAQLIKGFFRELPIDDPGLITSTLLQANNEEKIINAFENMSEPRKSILLWIFDLWIEVEKYKNKNKMTLQSLSIVFSPNLVRSENLDNPMIFLQYQKEAQSVLEQAALLRSQGKLNPSQKN